MKTGSNKPLIVLAAAAAFLLARCASNVEDTITQFQDGINANDVVKVSDTISKECVNYQEYANNNWSGLKALMDVWAQFEAPFAFSDFTVSGSGSTSDVTCTVSNRLGIFPSYFLMVQESDFYMKTWKIKKWKVDSLDDGFDTNDIRIQRFRPGL